MGTRRRLVLHMGIPKTGTSALQVAFVRNRERLAMLGVHYPAGTTDARAKRGLATTGNGLALQPFLLDPNLEPAQQVQVVGSVLHELDITGNGDVLYSSENLFGCRPERLTALRDRLGERDVAVHAVVYLRNKDTHAWSAYAQNVKRSRYARDFLTFLTAPDSPYRFPWRPQLERLLDILGADQLTVLHYESERPALEASYFRSVHGIDDIDGFDLSAGLVNRSLTRREVDLLRYLNPLVSSENDTRRLDDVLQTLPPLGDEQLELGHDEAALLEERYRTEVEWINARFFGDRPRLQVISEGTTTAGRAEPALSDSEEFLLTALARVLAERRPPARPPEVSRRRQGGPL